MQQMVHPAYRDQYLQHFRPAGCDEKFLNHTLKLLDASLHASTQVS